MWNTIHKVVISKQPASFLDAVEVWIKKPHVVNRRLCGAKLLWQQHYHGNKVDDFLKDIKHGTDDSASVSDDSALVSDDSASVSEEVHNSLSRVQSVIKHLNVTMITDVNNATSDEDARMSVALYVRDLLPKGIDKHAVLREVVIVDSTNYLVYFLPTEFIQPDKSVTVIDQPLGYRIQLQPMVPSLSLDILGTEESYATMRGLGYTLSWLQQTLLPKLASWCTESLLNTDIKSLKLVPIDKYNELYQELKRKYGLPMVEKWPERTDPQKFVYEDVAIAAYLLLLWEDDRQKKGLVKKQSFVDLGCGNGLLVYILTAEGHPGLGLDIRRRKIWDLYDIPVNLQENTITPSDECLFPDYDWLIGNHSDELTPWIPVMAARSSYESCFFVLPCCPWDFCSKFGQRASGLSQYRNYLNFVAEVTEACGFTAEEDMLRIPSTKRVCFIGRCRVYSKEQEAEVDRSRQNYINDRCKTTSIALSGANRAECDGIPTETEQTGKETFLSSEILHCICDSMLGSSNSRVVLCDNSVTEAAEPAHAGDGSSHSVNKAAEPADPVPGDRSSHSVTEAAEPADPVPGDRSSHSVTEAAEPKVHNEASNAHRLCLQCGRPVRSSSVVSNSLMQDSNSDKSFVTKRKWTGDFQARDAVERSRNCITVNSEVKDRITHTVFLKLLGMEGCHQVSLADGQTWNKGGTLPLSEVATLFDQGTLQQLKKECGGLQTLLRNSHHIFRVQGGAVELRDWISDDYEEYQKQKRRRKGRSTRGSTTRPVKMRLCYFYEHHPGGCPLASEQCRFAHGEDEIQKVAS